MRSTLSILAAAAVSAVVSAQSADTPCLVKYNQCVAEGTPKIVCNCNLNACSQTSPHDDPFCVTATAALLASISATSSLPPTTSASTTETASLVFPDPKRPGPTAAPKVTALAHSIPFGEPCNSDEQCAEGVQCWGQTGDTILTCGNFNAKCENDSQCAFNTCVKGSCSGSLATSLWNVRTVVRTSTSSTTSPSSTSEPSSTSSCPSSSATSSSTAAAASSTMMTTSMTTMTTFAVVPSPPAPSSAGPSVPQNYNSTTIALAPPPPSAPGVAKPTTSSTTTTTPPSSPSPSTVPFTGEASLGATLSWLAALIAGLVAWAL